METFGKRHPENFQPREESGSDFLNRNLQRPEISVPINAILKLRKQAGSDVSTYDNKDIAEQYKQIQQAVSMLSGGKTVSDEDISTLLSRYDEPLQKSRLR